MEAVLSGWVEQSRGIQSAHVSVEGGLTYSTLSVTVLTKQMAAYGR